jgi:hypothetical protein
LGCDNIHFAQDGLIVYWHIGLASKGIVYAGIRSGIDKVK